MRRRFALLIAITAACTWSSALADIFRWDTGQLIPGTQGITPGPGVFLENRHLEYADLADLDLSRTYFHSATLSDADLSGSILVFANLREATLIDANLAGANLTSAQVASAKLTDADLSGANLSRANLNSAVLGGANLSGAVLSGARMQATTYFGLTQAQFQSTASYQSKNLQGIDLSHNEMNGWNFSGHNLADAQLSDSFLRVANFSGAHLAGATLESSRLQNANLTMANLTNGNLHRAMLTGANLNGANLSGADLSEAVSTGANLSEADLTGASLAYADLTGGNLRMANLTRAALNNSVLTNADLSGANLGDAQFSRATLANADLSDALVTGAFFGEGTAYGFTRAQLESTASYKTKNLEGIGLSQSDLTGWDFSGQNLAGAFLYNSTLTNTDFSGAVVRGAFFGDTTSRGFTQGQLRSTASHKAKNLEGISLNNNDLTGWDFSGQNLAGANLGRSILTDVNLSGAIVTGAFFGLTTSSGFTQAQLKSTASYAARDLRGIQFFQDNLTGWDLSGQNLAGASFDETTLTNVNLHGAIVTGVHFQETTARGFTQAQLKSTASYQARDLQGIWLSRNNLTGWDFRGQFLANAFFYEANLTNADLTGADLRGANLFFVRNLPDSPNVIDPKGHIEGLSLDDGQTLVVRNYLGDPIRFLGPLPILVEHQLTMDETGRLELLFDEAPWHSTISFSPQGAPVVLSGGTLSLAFEDGVDVAGQLGRTLDVFDWTAADRVGVFFVETPYVWDLSQLYSTGEIRLVGTGEPVGLVGDFDASGTVEQADLDLVLLNWGSRLADPAGAGWTNDPPLGAIDQEELDKVLLNWGSSQMNAAGVPEPAAGLLIAIVAATAIVFRTLTSERPGLGTLGQAARC